MAAGDDNREDVKTLMQLAGQLINEGRLQQSAAVARRVTELAPNDPAGWFLMGSALLGLGEADEAELCLEKALRLEGARLEYCRLMAQACMQRGDMKKAAEWCEQGIGLEHNSLHLHLTSLVPKRLAETSTGHANVLSVASL